MAARLVQRLEETSHPTTATTTRRSARSASARQEVLRLLAEGRTDREIAEALTISPRTVETHVGGILHKLGVTRRAEAARRYRAPD